MTFTWTQEQLNFLLTLNFAFDVTSNLADEEIFEIDYCVSNYLVCQCIENDEVFGDGFLCEIILDIVNSD